MNPTANHKSFESRPLLNGAGWTTTNQTREREASSLGVKCRISALRILTTTVLKQMESIESQPEQQFEIDVPSLVREFEAQLIRSVLELTGGHQRRAARILGLKANTLNNKMRRHEIGEFVDLSFTPRQQ
jgi:DNA-binding NtrC family response regulator